MVSGRSVYRLRVLAEPSSTFATREHCYRCDKVKSLCLCSRIPQVAHKTRISVVQHPREARHPFGTVRIVRLGLSGCKVQVAHRERVDLSGLYGKRAAVLFPGEEAVELESLPPAARPEHLVVVDGTWPQARRLMKVSAALRSLPRVTFRSGSASNYRIRREPNDRSISTVEAIVRALTLLEPENREVGALLGAFDEMVDDQLRVRSSLRPQGRARLRKRAGPRAPEMLRVASERLVLMHVEQHRPREQPHRHPLRVAMMSSSGVRDWLVKEGPAPSAARIDNMRLGAVDFALGLTLDELAAEMRAQLRQDSVIVAWPHSVAPFLRRLHIDQPFVCLKHVAANLGLEPATVNATAGAQPVAGRSGAQLLQLAQTLKDVRAGWGLNER